MYYVNHEQIELRLAIVPELAAAAGKLGAVWDGRQPDPLHGFAQERLLHLAIELVTDVGSLLIDGFLMRDASSYEDIVDIVRGEGVFGDELVEPLKELVRLRRPLVQHYMELRRDELHGLTVRLPELLPRFEQAVRAFIEKELNG